MFEFSQGEPETSIHGKLKVTYPSLILSYLCISPVALLRFGNMFNYSERKQKRYFKKTPNI